MLFSTAVTAIGLLAAQAAAHGAVTSYVIDGTTYPGYVLSSLIVYPQPANNFPQLRRLRSSHKPEDHPVAMARLQPHHDRDRQEGHVQRRYLCRPHR